MSEKFPREGEQELSQLVVFKFSETYARANGIDLTDCSFSPSRLVTLFGAFFTERLYSVRFFGDRSNFSVWSFITVCNNC